MVGFPKNFILFLSRLSIAGIIVLSGFHLGSVFYVSGITRGSDKIEVRTIARKIDNLSGDLVLHVQEYKRTVPTKIVRSWFEPYVRDYSGKEDMRISPEKVEGYLVLLASSINIQPVNAKFILIEGKAEEIDPPEYGRRLDIEASKKLLIDTIVSGTREVSLPVEMIEPAITLDRINQLGITTLIGRGESDFKGSSRARVHNIRIGSAKYNGVILKPGEVFSFNSVLGEVSEQNGFESELVIKGGGLVKEAGGGLCQVSTTLFRSAIMAGLPILERRPHSFPVRYYNPQGFDATIYPGVSDLKFKNDTSNHILIQSRTEDTKLIFDIYGPDDGRKIVLDGPHQYDQRSNGSMKAYFVRKIYDNELLAKEERFDSNYGAPLPLERNPLE